MFPAECHCWKYALSLQECSSVTLDDVAVLRECCTSARDSSLNLLVLVLVSGAGSLSQLDVAFNVFDRSVGDIYWCVVFHHHFLVSKISRRNMLSSAAVNSLGDVSLSYSSADDVDFVDFIV